MPVSAAAALIVVAVILGVAIYLTPVIWWDKQKSFLKHRGGSRLCPTPTGNLEYAVYGEGIPILMMNGAGGSYRQELLSKSLDMKQFQIIGWSRPGYRFTKLSAGRTPDEQVELAVQLLDHLKIKKAAVMGVSAGGTAAIKFAHQHPDRCLGLILCSAAINAPGGLTYNPFMPFTFRALMSFDLLAWLSQKAPLESLVASHGWVDPVRLSDETIRWMLRDIFNELFPFSAWRDGFLNDLRQYQDAGNLPFEEVKVKSLVIHGTTDRTAPIGASLTAIKRIPNAQPLIIERGTHLIIATHHREISAAIEAFLKSRKK